MKQLIISNDQLTMSSIEIAELTGKNHYDVRRDIENVLQQAEIDFSKFADVSRNSQNQEVKIFNLPKRECDLVVSGYSVKYRLAIIDRWQELENQQPTTLSLEEMTLRVVQGQRERIMILEHKIEQDAPMTNFGKAISQTAGTVKIGDWIKAVNDSGDIKLGRNKAFDWLRQNGYLGKDNMPYQQYINNGLFEVKEGVIITDSKTIPTFTTLLTGKGQMYFAHKLKNSEVTA